MPPTRHDKQGNTILIERRFMPEQPQDSPFILPSEQFRGQNPPPSDDSDTRHGQNQTNGHGINRNCI